LPVVDDFGPPSAGPAVAEMFARLADPMVHVALGVTMATLAFAFRRDVRRRIGL